jgi:signal peptidase II
VNRKYYITAAVAGTGLLLDQAVKWWMQANLSPNGTVELVEDLVTLHYTRNPGIAFSLIPELPVLVRVPLFGVITLAAAAIIIHLLRLTPAAAVRAPLGLGLVLAGALGNQADRFHYTYVVDYLLISRYWPIFNIADACISAGIALLVLDLLLTPRPAAAEPVPAAASAAGDAPGDGLGGVG